MSGPQDLTLAVDGGPKGLSLFLGDLSAYFRGETEAQGGDVTMPRFMAKLFMLGLREASYRAEVFEEAVAVSTRLEAEVARLEAEIGRLRSRIATLTARPTPCSAWVGAAEGAGAGAEVK